MKSVFPLLAAICVVARAERKPGPFNVMNPDRYPEGAEQWDRLSEIIRNHPLLQNNLEQLSKLPLPPRISFHRPTMADGAGLDTILINPHPYNEKKGTMLVRSPYGPVTENLADLFVGSNGFAAVLQDDRGTFASGGKFDLWKGAGSDANDTISWITEQRWSNGEVFMAGISADGINAAMAATIAPTALKGQMWMWTTANGHHFVFNDGAYRQDLLDGYLNFMNWETHLQSKKVLADAKRHEAFSDEWWGPLSAHCPDADDSHPSAPGCVWKGITWPVVLVSGWWDIFHHTSIETWKGLTQATDPSVRDQHVHVINPLGHCTIDILGQKSKMLDAEADGFGVALNVAREMFAHDSSGPTRSRIGRLNMFVMGPFNAPSSGLWNYWTSLDDFPPFTPTSLFLSADSKLVSEPVESTGFLAYKYDPSHPTPFSGGGNLPLPGPWFKGKGCGSEDQAKRELRDDVLTFDSEILTGDMPVVGNIRAKLFVSSSADDTDFIVTVSDYDEKTSSLVRFGAKRMRWRDGDLVQAASLTMQVYEIDVDLFHTAYVFPKGHRIRVSVSSAAYPYYSANSNSGEQDLVGDITKVVARNSVFFSPDRVSQIILPVVAYEDIPENVHFTGESVEVTV